MLSTRMKIIVVSVSLAYVVVYTSGQSCLRYPRSSCLGPFTIRPSTVVKSPDRLSCDADKSLMDSCLKQCMADLCCRAFGIEEGKCILVNFHTERYNFVKEAQSWPVSARTCLNQVGCVGSVGRDTGGPFSLEQTFVDAASDLKAISGSFDREKFLVSIETDYGRGFVGSHVIRQGLEDFRCELADGEYITEVTGYIKKAWGTTPLIYGLKFTTTLKTCGPYGLVTWDVRTAKGNMLLYVTGLRGYGFDKLEFTFLEC